MSYYRFEIQVTDGRTDPKCRQVSNKYDLLGWNYLEEGRVVTQKNIRGVETHSNNHTTYVIG